MRLLISGGGTGGHVYPAVAVARELMIEERSTICFVGHASGVEAQLVPHEGFAFQSVKGASLLGSPLPEVPGRLWQVGMGVTQAWKIIGDFRPEAIFATGGYVCAPVILAGWLRRVPTLLYLPDIEPGLAVRTLSPFASRIAVSFTESRGYFPTSKVVVTGYPVRQEIVEVDKATAREELGLPQEEKVLLILGGSQGAHRINMAVKRALPALLNLAEVIHISGHGDEEGLRFEKERLPERLRGKYRLHPYLHQEIAWALAAADLAVARAGASTLGEFPAAGLPSLLVPYPYAAGHQERNADYLVERGAAVKIEDSELEERLLPTVERLLSNKILAGMAEAARRLAQPEAAKKMVRELKAIGEAF